MADYFLPKAILISLAVHTFIVCSGFWLTEPGKKNAIKAVRMEVSYKPQEMKKALDMRERPVKPAQKLDLKKTLADSATDVIPLKMEKSGEERDRRFSLYERKPVSIRSPQTKRPVAVVPIKSVKINNPAYTAYNDIVRSRIEEKVYANFSELEAGFVYLTFIVSADGTLKDFRVIEEKSRASKNLEGISVKSLKQAQFHPFLKEMTLPEYTFNIEIQYLVRE